MAINWSFISNQNGEIKGINDSGVATFRGTPLKSLAREICQNSLDAFVDDTPVVVEFHSFDIPIENVPGYEELKDAFVRSKQYWSSQTTSQTRDFFDSALKEYEKGTISVLRISDFNTKGLRGSREPKDTDWTNLTKSSGVSDKHGTAGGSYGIGKYATFACSKFSTVFYSTYDINNEQASQGISRIVTFERADGESTTGLGFYGEEKNKPIYEQMSLDPNFSRKLEQYGTDIYILAFAQAQADWKREIILSILDSFLIAFWKNKLTVIVDDVEISKKTLSTLMEEYKESVDGHVCSYYKVLTSEETKWVEEENFYGLGLIKFGVLLMDDEASRRVAMVRKTGMKIKDQGSISGYIPFMGVMLIEGEEINTALRLMENPQHTEWEPKRSANEQRSREILTALNSFMKKKVEDFAMQGSVMEIDAVGLGELLPDEIDADTNKKRDENVNNATATIESKVIKHKERKPTQNRTPAVVPGELEPGNDDMVWPPKPEPPQPGPHPIPPTPHVIVPGEKTVKHIPKQIGLEKFVFFAPDRTNGKYVIMLIPAANGNDGVVELEIAGEVYNSPVTIKSATQVGGKALNVDQNKIVGLQFEKGKQIRISLELDYHDYCALEVNAYAN